MLEVRNMETWYDRIRVLHGISFDVHQGNIVALLGSNGAGKSTTLKTIMRLLYDLKEQQPEKGTITFEGQRIDRKDTDEIVRLGISYVPEGREVFPELTVMENIRMGAYTRKDTKGTGKTAGRLSERRGTANAGHRAGAHEPAEAPHAR
jgi:branched-chain amino acid transport system ATP-binding protein